MLRSYKSDAGFVYTDVKVENIGISMREGYAVPTHVYLLDLSSTIFLPGECTNLLHAYNKIKVSF